MPMLERYLNAIAFWLPEEQRKDLLAEIAEDLNAQIEEQQATLGRNLNDADLAALLKRRGRPVVVANAYRPQRSLIGPLWFPAYLFALKIVGLCYVLPWILVFTVIHRVQQPALPWSGTLLAAWGTLWEVGFTAAGVVTLIFALLEFYGKRSDLLDKWSPRQLPPVRDPYKIALSSSIAELVANIAFLIWWMAYASSPIMINRSTFQLSLGPAWSYFFWSYSALAVFNIALAASNLRNRAWSGWRAAGRLVLDLAGGALFCWLIRAHLVATLYVANLSAAQTIALRNAIHLWEDRCFPIAVIVVAIIVSVDLMRILRLNKKDRVVLARGIVA